MKRSILVIALSLLLAGLIAATPAMAQDHNKASEMGEQARQKNMPEDAMKVVGPNERPDDVDKELTLPESASEQGKESSSHGMDTANEAREKGKEFGQERAEEARESGSERAEQVRERARERAEEAREQTRGEKVRDQMRDRNQDKNGR